MQNCITALLRREDAKEIQTEYRILLSAGVADLDAEDAIVSFFLSDYSDDRKGLFWLIFALIQWKVGRLSKRVFDAAREYLHDSHCILSYAVAEEIANVLSSPMPKRKHIVKPHTLKCPWDKGSLLAYQITTNSEKSDSRFWNQYVLLRIIEIKKWPLSSIMPHLLYDESMYVAMYNWVGTSIPDPNVVATLEFTPISFRKPFLTQLSEKASCNCLRSVNDSNKNIIFASDYSDYVFALDWGSKNNAATVFTNITACQENEEREGRDGLKMKNPPMIGCVGFDTVLINRLEQLFPIAAEDKE